MTQTLVSGDVDVQSAGPVVKRYFHGTHRNQSPIASLARLRTVLSAVGITRVANVTGLDRTGVPVVMVCRPNSRSVAVFQGKGLTLEAAKVSGIMEALELWHAERIIRPLKLASVEELQAHHRIAKVTDLPRSAGAALDATAPILWVEGTDLLGSGEVWVPYELVSTNYTLPLPTGSGVFQATSNGLASGNHWLEAVSHGVCEVIERDARTLWELSSPECKDRRLLDLGTVSDPACHEVLSLMRAARLDVQVWDATSDIGIATFVCQLLDPEEVEVDPEVGSGCHPARHIALLRAITEAAQARTTFIAGARDDFFSDHYAFDARAQRRAAMTRRTSQAARPRAFEQVPDFMSETIDEDLRWILARLRAAGIEQVVAVDLTREAIGIPVVRVVVPGLEGPIAYGQSDYVPGARARRGNTTFE